MVSSMRKCVVPLRLQRFTLQLRMIKSECYLAGDSTTSQKLLMQLNSLALNLRSPGCYAQAPSLSCRCQLTAIGCENGNAITQRPRGYLQRNKGHATKLCTTYLQNALPEDWGIVHVALLPHDSVICHRCLTSMWSIDMSLCTSYSDIGVIGECTLPSRWLIARLAPHPKRFVLPCLGLAVVDRHPQVLRSSVRVRLVQVDRHPTSVSLVGQVVTWLVGYRLHEMLGGPA
nr:hypothetical protein Iba_chr01cCG3140 [Ipomoea batatas]